MNYSKLTEQELLEIVLSDSLAMEELLSRYKSLVKQVARSYFLIGAEPEDLIQEGMIGLHSAILSYKESCGNFKTFAMMCIKRRLISAVKIANRQKYRLLNESISLTAQGGIKNNNSNTDDEDEIYIIPSDELSPLDQMIAKEEYIALQNYINTKLSTFEKKVLKLYLDGLSYLQISQKLDCNTKSIENALNRLRAKILEYEECN